MADRTRLTSFRASEDMDSDLRDIERRFQEGEYGEIVFRLNRTKAATAGEDNVRRDMNTLANQLESRGMEPWPGEDLVTLDWSNRRISIRFVQTRTPSSMYRTPAFIGFALVGARGAAAAAPIIARGGTMAWIISRFGVFARTVGAKFAAIGGRITKSNAIALAGTGLLIWSLIDVGSLVEVFKWIGKKAGGFAKDLLGTPLLLGFGVLAVGLVLMSRGR